MRTDIARGLSEYLDLSRLAADDQLVLNGAVAQEKKRLLAKVREALNGGASNAEQLAEAFVDIIADLTVRIEVMEQQLAARRRSRAERLAIDPLPFISSERRADVPEVARRFELDLQAPGFNGYGWYDLESENGHAWRWSRSDGVATIMLPTLGGGKLSLTLTVQMPFGAMLDIREFQFLANDTPIVLQDIVRDRTSGTFQGEVILDSDNGLGRFTLTIQGISTGDAELEEIAGETRRLGIGLSGLSVEVPN